MNVSFHTLLLPKEIAFQCERLLHCSSLSGVWLPPASDTARKAAAPVVLDQDDELICGLSVAKLLPTDWLFVKLTLNCFSVKLSEVCVLRAHNRRLRTQEGFIHGKIIAELRCEKYISLNSGGT